MDRSAPQQMALLLHMSWRHQKGLGCGLLTALINVTSSCMFANFQTEMAGKGTPETNPQKAMAAVAVPPMSAKLIFAITICKAFATAWHFRSAIEPTAFWMKAPL
ncbi:hypothetical protein N9M78_03285 [Alphaproteobacteria bacterium]|nr:hypothetical protein [Alphaproteobacteria bacterium]